jgi:hypothetical protein
MTRLVRFRSTAAAVALALIAPAVALADASNAERADQLFNAGKARMAEGKFSEACALLAESFALDPATGGLLALAVCHEREGKLASALSEYGETATRSQRENRADREKAARDKIAELEAKVSTLTVAVSSELGGDVEVRIDDRALDRALLGKAAAFDGGEHRIDASAPGKSAWSTRVSLAASSDAKTVLVPPLQPEAPAPAPAAEAAPEPEPPPRRAAPAPAPARPRRSPADSSLSATEWLGIGTLAAGLVGVGAGVYFLVDAAAKDEDSKNGCDRDVCTLEAGQARLDASAARNASALSFVVGGLLVSTGLAVYLTHQSSSGSSDSAHGSPITATAWVAPGAAGTAVRGKF